MIITETLITDRKEPDLLDIKRVNNLVYTNMTADEKAILSANGGAYRHTDMNRVSAAINELHAALQEAGYAIANFNELETNWDDADRPTKAELEEYISVVNGIKAALPTQTEVPETMKRLTIDGANNIEKLLLEVEDLLERLMAVYLRSGTIYSGNSHFYITEAI